MTSRLDALKGKFTQIKESNRDAISDTAPVEKTVKDIIANVRERGDAAVREYSIAFDKADVTNFEVTQEESSGLSPISIRKREKIPSSPSRTYAASLKPNWARYFRWRLRLFQACTLAIASSRSKLSAAMSQAVVTPSFRLP